MKLNKDKFGHVIKMENDMPVTKLRETKPQQGRA